MIVGLLLYSILLLPAVFCGDCEETRHGIPVNIVQNHVKDHVDYSVDPCDDFYAHVCPETTKNHFMLELKKKRDELVERYKRRNSDFDQFNDEKTMNLSNNIPQLIKFEDLTELCQDNASLLSLFLRHLIKIAPGQDKLLQFVKTASCKEHADFTRKVDDPISKFRKSREILSKAVDSEIAHSRMRHLDKKLRDVFKKLKIAVGKAFAKTPWARNNKAVRMYQDALRAINFTTFADIENNVKSAVKEYKASKQECMTLISGMFQQENRDTFCDVVATGKAYRMLIKHIDSIYEEDRTGIIGDVLQMFNSKDNVVYVGNDFKLLANTDYQSDLYGSIGFSLTHEIMHTFVFDEMDIRSGKPLYEFWTKNADCVREQAIKTCETFPTVRTMDGSLDCDIEKTFEEDAADLAAYRIVYDQYQKMISRKTVVPNYESLNEKQLFFYGAGVVFCQMNGMRPTENTGDLHSNSYQRVNSLMSQMDEFADAFQCRPTDKMVVNKARHCELYGQKAIRKNYWQ